MDHQLAGSVLKGCGHLIEDHTQFLQRENPAKHEHCYNYVCVRVCVCIDCTRKWIDNVVQIFLSSSVRSRDKIARVRGAPARDLSYSSVLSPEVDKSTIQLPTLLLVVGAVSLPLKCEYFL